MKILKLLLKINNNVKNILEIISVYVHLPMEGPTSQLTSKVPQQKRNKTLSKVICRGGLRSKKTKEDDEASESSEDEVLSDLVDVKVSSGSPLYDGFQQKSCKLKTKARQTRKTSSSNTTFIPMDPIRTSIPNLNTEVLNLEVCRVCLLTDSKLFPIKKYDLAETYKQVTGLPLDSNDGLPQTLCVVCAALINKGQRLRVRSHQAYKLLKRLLEKRELSIQNIREYREDAKKNKLLSNFQYKYLGSDYYNEQYVFDENQIKEPPSDFQSNAVINDEIKLEDEPLNIADDEYLGDDNADPIDVLEPSELATELEDIEKPIETHKNDATTRLNKKKSTKAKKVKLKKVTKKRTKRIDLKKTVKRFKLDNDENKVVKEGRKKTEKVQTEVQMKMDEYFTVTIFKSMEEKIEELQKRKENSSYINAPLKCQYCFQGYLDNETYDQHMHKHSDNYGGFVCDVCQYRCPSKERLRQHLYFRHSRKFHCKVCPFESHDKYRATLHMKFHEGKTYKCKHCDKVFNHIVNLHNHLRAKHPTDNVCEMCGYSFIGERGLKTHRSLTHGHHLTQVPADAPCCVECNVRFVSEEALQMHLKVSSRHGKTVENFKKRNYHQLHRSIKRSGEDKPRREKETKITRKRDGIRVEKREIRLTKFDEPVPCEKCGIEIASASEYHYHFKRAHPNDKRSWYPTDTHPHLCDVCGKMLRNNALKDHMLEHVEGVTFKCDTCGKKFNKKFNMKLHARVHLGERYPCVVCGKLFNHMGNRDRHLKYVHTESKDFKCEFCGKCFKNDGARKLHTNHVHLRKPYPKRNRNREGQIDVARRRQKETDGEENIPTFRSDCNDLWE